MNFIRDLLFFSRIRRQPSKIRIDFFESKTTLGNIWDIASLSLAPNDLRRKVKALMILFLITGTLEIWTLINEEKQGISSHLTSVLELSIRRRDSIILSSLANYWEIELTVSSWIASSAIYWCLEFTKSSKALEWSSCLTSSLFL